MQRQRSVGFTFMLGALAGLTPLSIDMNLPALPIIAADLGASTQAATATLGAFMTSFALTQLLYGPLSDRFGRRPLLLIGCLIYLVGGIGCLFAPGITFLILARFVQGAGAGAGFVLVRAVIRDVYDDPVTARVQFSYITMVVQIAPVIAPLIGTLILVGSGDSWRAIFLCLALAGGLMFFLVAARFDETIRDRGSGGMAPGQVMRNYMRVFTNPVCLPNALINGLSFGALFAYVTGSSLVFVTTLGWGTGSYAAVFAAVSAGIILGSYLNARITRSGAPLRQALAIGIFGAVAGSGLSLAALSHGVPGRLAMIALVAGLMLNAFSFGFVIPNTTQAALEPVPDIAGTAAAVLGCIQIAGGAASSAVVGLLFVPLGASAMPLTMLAFSLGSLLLYLRLASETGRA